MHCILFDIWHKKPTNIYGFYLEMNEKCFVSMNEYDGLINKFKEIISLGPQWSDKDLYSVFLSY